MNKLFGTVMLIIALFVAGHVDLAASAPSNRVSALTTLRVSDSNLRQAVELGLLHSSTLRNLESRLEQEPVIVYVERATLSSTLAGRTRLIGFGGGWRYLLIEIDRRVDSIGLLTTIGHEMQHALEIAEAKDVVDPDTLAALYRRIGLETFKIGPNVHGFETSQAVEVGRRVRAELNGFAILTFN